MVQEEAAKTAKAAAAAAAAAAAEKQKGSTAATAAGDESEGEARPPLTLASMLGLGEKGEEEEVRERTSVMLSWRVSGSTPFNQRSHTHNQTHTHAEGRREDHSRLRGRQPTTGPARADGALRVVCVFVSVVGLLIHRCTLPSPHFRLALHFHLL